MSKCLIIVNSVYQLFTAIHMKTSLLEDRRADLIVTDITSALKGWMPGLRESGLFERVLFAQVRELNSKYMTGKPEEIEAGYRNIPAILRWALSDELEDYGQIYFSNFDTFARMLANDYDGENCEFICYEDGFSTYVINFLRPERARINQFPEAVRIREKLKYYLLYEPGLSRRDDGILNRPLPKVSVENKSLKNILNVVFNYKSPERLPDFIFLEQSFRAEGIETNEMELIRRCRDGVSGKSFIVKSHPRNEENLAFELGLSRRESGNLPWELFVFNEWERLPGILTICSNAALTGRLIFGLDTPTVMLYPLFKGRVLWKEDEALAAYLYTFRKQFAGKNYYVPETVYELKYVLDYIGGGNGKRD